MGSRVAVEIGLFGGGMVTWIDVEDLADLRRKLSDMGASEVVKYTRDLIGDGAPEGESMAVDSLSASYLEWAVEERIRERGER